MALVAGVFLFGCDLSPDGTNSEDPPPEDSDSGGSEFQSLDGVPKIPAVYAENFSGNSFDAQDFSETNDPDPPDAVRNFGVPFQYSADATDHYDGLMENAELVAFEELQDVEAEDISYGPFTSRRANDRFAYYENDDGSEWCVKYNEDSEGCSQLSKSPQGDVDYARGYYFMADPPFIEILEIWDFDDRKEICVKIYYKDQNNGHVNLAIIEKGSGEEKTTLLSGGLDPVDSSDDALASDQYSSIGYINLNMDKVMVSDAVDTDKENLPDGYPSYNQMLDLHNRSKVTLGQAIEALNDADADDLEPYIGFFD